MKYLILIIVIITLTNCTFVLKQVDTWNYPYTEKHAEVVIQESVYSYGIYLYRAKIYKGQRIASNYKNRLTSFYSYKEYCVEDIVSIKTDEEMYFLAGEYPRTLIAPIEVVLDEAISTNE